jgi:hypothetical protein
MCVYHGFEQGGVQRDVTANPKRHSMRTCACGWLATSGGGATRRGTPMSDTLYVTQRAS